MTIKGLKGYIKEKRKQDAMRIGRSMFKSILKMTPDQIFSHNPELFDKKLDYLAAKRYESGYIDGERDAKDIIQSIT